jgi:formylglycine-generating enzyme required for sulfatase activity
VLRGGSWGSRPGNLRSAFRFRGSADAWFDFIGFRLVYREPLADGRRVLRGGSWLNDPEFVRSAYRTWFNADVWFHDFGFRLVYREKSHV